MISRIIPILSLLLISCSGGGESPLFTPSHSAPGGGGGAPIAYTTSYSISVTLLGSGNVMSKPPGVNCGSGTCSVSFSGGTSVTLTATPQSGSTFLGWSGDCGGTAPCTVVMNSNKSVTATFLSGSALNVTSIDGGSDHTCGLILRSLVACWGANDLGQLGDGTTASSLIPKIVYQGRSFDRVSAGDKHTCVMVSQGNIQCWGSNRFGQLGNGTTGDSNSPVTVTGMNYPVSVSAGGAHTCGLGSDGSVFCWGLNSSGQLGDGTLNSSSKPVLVFGVTSSTSATVTSISAGENHTCALVSDGSVFCWGSNQFGQLGNGSTSISSNKPVMVFGLTSSASPTAKAISSGGNHSCVLMSDGTVLCWGSNSFGQLGNGSPAGGFSNVPASVAGLSRVSAISAGGAHTCALISNGTIQCWGSSQFGQVGNITAPVSQTTPVLVDGINTAVSIGTGLNHTCAVLSNQTVECWGNNQSGQLGLGFLSLYSTTPQPVNTSGL